MPCGITMQTTNHQPLITNFMASFVIEGGHRLSGDIYPQGAKNEVLQIICATLLTAEEVTVHNIPDILDVNNLIQLMRDMGASWERSHLSSFCCQFLHIDICIDNLICKSFCFC